MENNIFAAVENMVNMDCAKFFKKMHFRKSHLKVVTLKRPQIATILHLEEQVLYVPETKSQVDIM